MTIVSSVLSAPREQSACLADFLARAAANGLNANGWQTQQFARITADVEAETIASYEVNRKTIFDGGYIGSATGVYLDLAATWYGERRNAATTTIVQLRLADGVGAGPYSLPPGQVAVWDPTGVAGGPLYYRSTTSIDIPRGGAVNALFAAEAAGGAYNVAPGSITSLKTPQPGVVVTSPALTGQGAITVVEGSDAELDAALILRCLLKLATLGTGWAKDTIASLILDNFPAVTRLLVRDPGGNPGIVEAYLAGPLYPVSAATALAVYTFLADETRKPVGNMPVRAYQATQLTKSITVQLYSDGTNPNAEADAASRLALYQASLALGARVFASRVVDEYVDVPLGILGAHVTDDETGLPLEDFEPRYSDSVLLSATYLPTIQV